MMEITNAATRYLGASIVLGMFAMPLAAKELPESTATPFERGDVFIAATVMDNPDDDHGGTGRILQ
jgi:hypothetical protein